MAVQARREPAWSGRIGRPRIGNAGTVRFGSIRLGLARHGKAGTAVIGAAGTGADGHGDAGTVRFGLKGANGGKRRCMAVSGRHDTTWLIMARCDSGRDRRG
jgi:hypothetical protein